MDYQIKKPLVGEEKVLYKCPGCGIDLQSKLSEAGRTDFCPNCHDGFFVPGRDELAQWQREVDEEAFACSRSQIAGCDREMDGPRARLRSRLVACPHCGNAVSRSAVLCPGCGYPFRYAVDCPDCGCRVLKNSLACPSCGRLFRANVAGLRSGEALRTMGEVLLIIVKCFITGLLLVLACESLG